MLEGGFMKEGENDMPYIQHVHCVLVLDSDRRSIQWHVLPLMLPECAINRTECGEPCDAFCGNLR
jgi:hypothetical protein